MRGDVRGYKKAIDLRDQCGKLTAFAEDEFDAILLGKIATALFYDPKEYQALLDHFGLEVPEYSVSGGGDVHRREQY